MNRLIKDETKSFARVTTSRTVTTLQHPKKIPSDTSTLSTIAINNQHLLNRFFVCSSRLVLSNFGKNTSPLGHHTRRVVCAFDEKNLHMGRDISWWSSIVCILLGLVKIAKRQWKPECDRIRKLKSILRNDVIDPISDKWHDKERDHDDPATKMLHDNNCNRLQRRCITSNGMLNSTKRNERNVHGNVWIFHD